MAFNFTQEFGYFPKVFQTRDGKEVFLQWGFENILTFQRFKVDGSIRSIDDQIILNEFFLNNNVRDILQLTGLPDNPLKVDSIECHTTVRSMSFFDSLLSSNIIASQSGSIMGCFEDVYDGLTISDLLKEVLVNPDSENSSIFTTNDKNEFLYQLFKLLYIGGPISQPDVTINRYLDISKDLYKECLVLYKASGSGTIQSACRIYHINSVPGVDLYSRGSNPSHSHLFVIINHLEKYITTIKLDYKSFW